MIFFKKFLVSQGFIILASLALFFIILAGKASAQDASFPVNSTELITYHCIVVSDQVDGFMNGDCQEFTVASDDNADYTARLKCANNSTDADKVENLPGPCTSELQSSPENAADTGKSTGDLQKDAASRLNPAGIVNPTQLVGRFIKILLAFIGSISLVLYIFAGILWMTASGASERVDKAKKILVWTTLGVVIMLTSYMLASFVFKSLEL